MRFRVGALLVAVLAVAAAPTFAQVTGAVKVGANFSKGTFSDEDDDGQEFSSNTGTTTGSATSTRTASARQS